MSFAYSTAAGPPPKLARQGRPKTGGLLIGVLI